MHVPFFPRDEFLEHELACDAGTLHGHVGHWCEPRPQATRPIGFRLPARLVNGFPCGPAISIDGKTWEACDLRDVPP